MTAPNPPVNLIVRPPTVPRPTPVVPVVQVRPILTAAGNAASIAAATAVYTGTAPILLAAGAAAGLVGGVGYVGQRMRVNRQATGRTFGHGSGTLGRGTGGAGRGHTQGGAAASRRRASMGAGGTGRMGSLLRGRTRAGAMAGGAPPRGRATGRGNLLRAGRVGSALGRMFPGRNRRSVDARAHARKSSDVPSSRRSSGLRKFGAALAAPLRMMRNRRNPTAGPGGRKPGDATTRNPSQRKTPSRAQTSGKLRTLVRKFASPFGRKTRATVHRKPGDVITPEGRKSGRKTGRKSDPAVTRPAADKLRNGDAVKPGSKPKIEPTGPVRRTTPTPDRELVSAARSGGVGMASGVRRLILEAEELQKLARRAEMPEGALEFIRVELRLYGDLMRALADVHKAYHDRVDETTSLHPAVLGSIEALQKMQLKAADAADAISGYAEKLEQKRIEALNDPRNAVWDHSANKGHI